MLPLKLYLLQLLLYLYALLIRRKVVPLLLRVMPIVIRVARYRLVYASLQILVWAGVLSAEESSLSHAFRLRIYDAGLLLWWWAFRLGELHHPLFHALSCHGSRWSRVVDVVWILVLHLIHQSLLELHLLLQLLLLVRQNRVLTLIVTHHRHVLLLLHLWWFVGLDDCSHELAVGIAHLVLSRRPLNRVGHRPWVLGCEVLLLPIEAPTKVHDLSLALIQQNRIVDWRIVVTLRALLEFHLIAVLIWVVVDGDRLPVDVVLADATASSLDRLLAHNVLMEGWGSHSRVMFIDYLLGDLAVEILWLLCRIQWRLLTWQWSSLWWSHWMLIKRAFALTYHRAFKLLDVWVVIAFAWGLGRWWSVSLSLSVLNWLPLDRLLDYLLLLLVHHVLLMYAVQVCADVESWLGAHLLLLVQRYLMIKLLQQQLRVV